MNELPDDLHHPVGAALGVRHDKDVLLARYVIAKRILAYNFRFTLVAHRRHHALGASGFLHEPEERGKDAFHPRTREDAEQERRLLPYEFGHADYYLIP